VPTSKEEEIKGWARTGPTTTATRRINGNLAVCQRKTKKGGGELKRKDARRGVRGTPFRREEKGRGQFLIELVRLAEHDSAKKKKGSMQRKKGL